MRRIVIDVGQEDGLRKWRFDVLARAAVTMPTGADLVIGKR
jgi:hypothetical protein